MTIKGLERLTFPESKLGALFLNALYCMLCNCCLVLCSVPLISTPVNLNQPRDFWPTSVVTKHLWNLWESFLMCCECQPTPDPGDQTVQDHLRRSAMIASEVCSSNPPWSPANLTVVLNMHAGLVVLRVGDEAACPTAVQEPASVPQRVGSWDSGQALQPSSDMSGCVQVRQHRLTPASGCREPLLTLCCLCVGRSAQRAALPLQELCDANAVPGPAAPPGSSVIMGQQRQSEVSHDGR